MLKPYLSLLLLLLFVADLGAQITIKQSSATIRQTITARTKTEVLDLAGQPIGEPILSAGTTSPEEIKPAVIIELVTDADLAEVMTKVESSTCVPKRLSPTRYLIDNPGRHEIKAELINWTAKTWEQANAVVRIEGDDQDQDEEPGPAPTPEPEPEPEPEPATVEALRVLVVYESAQLAGLPESQREILFSKPLRDWLQGNTVKVNGVSAYRFFDQNQQFAPGADPAFKELMKRERASLPWLILQDADSGRVAYEGPLPANLTGMLQKLNETKPPRAPALKPAAHGSLKLVPIYQTVCERGVCREVVTYQWREVR